MVIEDYYNIDDEDTEIEQEEDDDDAMEIQ